MIMNEIRSDFEMSNNEAAEQKQELVVKFDVEGQEIKLSKKIVQEYIVGSDVPITITVIVIILVLTFNVSAKTLALSTTKSLAIIIPIQHITESNIDVNILYFGLLYSKNPCFIFTTDII